MLLKCNGWSAFLPFFGENTEGALLSRKLFLTVNYFHKITI
jgi:hypothetical protein